MLLKLAKSKISLLARIKCPIISHKSYFGQGGELHFDLRRRTYAIKIETIWEDYSLLEIEGLTGTNNFTLYEQEGVSYFRDEELHPKEDEKIAVSLKIPEDYTLKGVINGSIMHGSGTVGKKMRSKPFALGAVGADRQLTLGDVKSQDVSLTNHGGTISVPSLTVQTGTIRSKAFESQKLMTSGSIEINSSTVSIRSIIMFGKSHGIINGRDIEIESISGSSQITSESTLKIERYYGGENNINISCKSIKNKLGIESGTGRVEFSTEQDAIKGQSKVILGRMHKGRLDRQGKVILIC